MLEIFNFLKVNWQFIAALILIIISFILTLIQKKPVSSINEDIYYLSTVAVQRAEESGLKGSDKLDLAIQFVVNSLKNKYPGIKTDTYIKLIVLIIEEILSTPHKK